MAPLPRRTGARIPLASTASCRCRGCFPLWMDLPSTFQSLLKMTVCAKKAGKAVEIHASNSSQLSSSFLGLLQRDES